VIEVVIQPAHQQGCVKSFSEAIFVLDSRRKSPRLTVPFMCAPYSDLDCVPRIVDLGHFKDRPRKIERTLLVFSKSELPQAILVIEPQQPWVRVLRQEHMSFASSILVEFDSGSMPVEVDRRAVRLRAGAADPWKHIRVRGDRQ
jgi:hypothetical protein